MRDFLLRDLWPWLRTQPVFYVLLLCVGVEILLLSLALAYGGLPVTPCPPPFTLSEETRYAYSR